MNNMNTIQLWVSEVLRSYSVSWYSEATFLTAQPKLSCASFAPLSLTECTPIVIQLCLRSWIGLWENYYYMLFDIMHYFSSDVGLFGLWDSLVRRQSKECQLCKDNVTRSCVHAKREWRWKLHLNPPHPPKNLSLLSVFLTEHYPQPCGISPSSACLRNVAGARLESALECCAHNSVGNNMVRGQP